MQSSKIEDRHIEKYSTHYTCITTSPISEYLIANRDPLRGILPHEMKKRGKCQQISPCGHLQPLILSTLHSFFFFFFFIFKLYIIVLVLPNIKMNPPQVYMCSPSWTLLPPPSPFHPSGLPQCTSPKHPVSEHSTFFTNTDTSCWCCAKFLPLHLFPGTGTVAEVIPALRGPVASMPASPGSGCYNTSPYMQMKQLLLSAPPPMHCSTITTPVTAALSMNKMRSSTMR